jgi:Stage II sporulation protein E (SpoIIE)
VTDLVEKVRKAVSAAPPGLIVEAMLAELARSAGVADGQLLLVDYRLAALVPLTNDANRVDAEAPAFGNTAHRPGGPAWRCFDRQELVDDGGAVLIPVSVRGDRWGVLRLGPADRLSDLRPRLLDLGDVLAHELAATRSATDRYVAGARTRRLTLAAEMQWEMLPGRSCSGEKFNLAGQLEPAYAVKGETFDWSVAPDRLTISVIDGMGEGVAAASLSMLATNALRNARRAGLGIVDQAMLADSALYAHRRGTEYVSVLLMEINLGTGLMSVVDTGSPVLVLVRNSSMTEVALDRHDPIGMFEGSRYISQQVQLEPGDRLVVVSDGVHAAVAAGRRYGENKLSRLVNRSLTLSPLDVVRTIVGDLRTFVTGELDDDAAAVCLDWTEART